MDRKRNLVFCCRESERAVSLQYASSRRKVASYIVVARLMPFEAFLVNDSLSENAMTYTIYIIHIVVNFLTYFSVHEKYSACVQKAKVYLLVSNKFNSVVSIVSLCIYEL